MSLLFLRCRSPFLLSSPRSCIECNPLPLFRLPSSPAFLPQILIRSPLPLCCVPIQFPSCSPNPSPVVPRCFTSSFIHSFAQSVIPMAVGRSDGRSFALPFPPHATLKSLYCNCCYLLDNNRHFACLLLSTPFVVCAFLVFDCAAVSASVAVVPYPLSLFGALMQRPLSRSIRAFLSSPHPVPCVRDVPMMTLFLLFVSRC